MQREGVYFHSSVLMEKGAKGRRVLSTSAKTVIMMASFLTQPVINDAKYITKEGRFFFIGNQCKYDFWNDKLWKSIDRSIDPSISLSIHIHPTPPVQRYGRPRPHQRRPSTTNHPVVYPQHKTTRRYHI